MSVEDIVGSSDLITAYSLDKWNLVTKMAHNVGTEVFRIYVRMAESQVLENLVGQGWNSVAISSVTRRGKCIGEMAVFPPVLFLSQIQRPKLACERVDSVPSHTAH